MKITEAELIARKSRIIHEAFQLFCRHGIDKVSIKSIALKAGVGEKSIYRYFSTKSDLLLETVLMLWTEIVSELTAGLPQNFDSLSGYDQIICITHRFLHLYNNNSEFILFSYDYKLFLVRTSAQLTVHEYSEVLRPIRELYIRALLKGKADGSTRVQADVDDIYFAIWGLLRGYVAKMVIYDKMYEGENPWTNRFDTALGLILSGMRNGI